MLSLDPPLHLDVVLGETVEVMAVVLDCEEGQREALFVGEGLLLTVLL